MRHFWSKNSQNFYTHSARIVHSQHLSESTLCSLFCAKRNSWHFNGTTGFEIWKLWTVESLQWDPGTEVNFLSEDCSHGYLQVSIAIWSISQFLFHRLRSISLMSGLGLVRWNWLCRNFCHFWSWTQRSAKGHRSMPFWCLGSRSVLSSDGPAAPAYFKLGCFQTCSVRTWQKKPIFSLTTMQKGTAHFDGNSSILNFAACTVRCAMWCLLFVAFEQNVWNKHKDRQINIVT